MGSPTLLGRTPKHSQRNKESFISPPNMGHVYSGLTQCKVSPICFSPLLMSACFLWMGHRSHHSPSVGTLGWLCYSCSLYFKEKRPTGSFLREVGGCRLGFQGSRLWDGLMCRCLLRRAHDEPLSKGRKEVRLGRGRSQAMTASVLPSAFRRPLELELSKMGWEEHWKVRRLCAAETALKGLTPVCWQQSQPAGAASPWRGSVQCLLVSIPGDLGLEYLKAGTWLLPVGPQLWAPIPLSWVPCSPSCILSASFVGLVCSFLGTPWIILMVFWPSSEWIIHIHLGLWLFSDSSVEHCFGDVNVSFQSW